ncbi:uncharacterized protein LOC120511803 [Passer montanus]|uniref:uncharacterized protein LOC120511803 n=1 Tax=Passer montanus TaxID=9160 RepID=UPI00195F5E2E|nr:uncharacterized protein LOC120511803 [Passer montanus]
MPQSPRHTRGEPGDSCRRSGRAGKRGYGRRRWRRREPQTGSAAGTPGPPRRRGPTERARAPFRRPPSAASPDPGRPRHFRHTHTHTDTHTHIQTHRHTPRARTAARFPLPLPETTGSSRARAAQAEQRQQWERGTHTHTHARTPTHTPTHREPGRIVHFRLARQDRISSTEDVSSNKRKHTRSEELQTTPDPPELQGRPRSPPALAFHEVCSLPLRFLSSQGA